MSDTPQDTSTTQEAPAAPARSRKKLIIIIMLAVLLVGSASGGFLFFRARAALAQESSKEKSEKKRRDDKSSREREEEKEKEKESAQAIDKDGKQAGQSHEKKLLEMALPEDGDVRQVVELQPFIVNLADTSDSRYLRMTVSIGVGEGEEAAAKPDPLFTTKIRNAMLAVLTSKRSEEILTPEGKATLRKELLQAAQAAAREPEVMAVYITDFIVQL